MHLMLDTYYTDRYSKIMTDMEESLDRDNTGEKKEDNRKKIIQSALHLFAAKGYANVGVQEICLVSKITKPTLYHYFGSKQNLFKSILDNYHTELWNRISSMVYEGDVKSRLEWFADTFFRFALKEREFYRLQLSLVYAPPESEEYTLGMVWLHRHYNLVQDFFEAASTDHGNMKGRHQIYALTFQGMIHNIITLLLKEDIDYGPRLVYKIVHQFMHGIFS